MDGIFDSYRFKVLLGSSAECQNLLDQFLGTMSGFENLVQVLMRQTVFGDFIHCQFSVPDDGKQDIVKVVGNTASQGADGLDFENLLQLTLIFGQSLGALFNLFLEDFILIP